MIFEERQERSLFITHTCPSSFSPPTKLLNFILNIFLSLQTYLQASISQFVKISQMNFEERQERSLFLSFYLLFHMNSSSKHSYIRFYGSITIIAQLIPPLKFQFVTLTRYCIYIFMTFPNSDRPLILIQGKNVCLKTPCKISTRSNNLIGRYIQYFKTG